MKAADSGLVAKIRARLQNLARDVGRTTKSFYFVDNLNFLPCNLSSE
jgi:hypothetical protein